MEQERNDQTNGIDTPLEQHPDRQIRNAENILASYGILQPEELYDLAKENTPESLEKLAEIAEHYDIIIDDAITPKELADKIVQELDKEDAPSQFTGRE